MALRNIDASLHSGARIKHPLQCIVNCGHTTRRRSAAQGGTSMHISNERYFNERQRHDLALRMIRHEARTCTIRSCTGLTDDRIRRLYKTYASHMPEVPIRRHRGKSPRQISFFTRNTQAQFESSLLAGLFAAFGLLESPQDAHAISLSAGTL